MSKLNLEGLNQISGFVGVALVDSDSGMAMATLGGGSLDLEVAGDANSAVGRSKRRVAQQVSPDDTIERILISLSKQYHIIRPLESNPALFLYVVLDRARANLAMAPHELKSFKKALDFS